MTDGVLLSWLSFFESFSCFLCCFLRGFGFSCFVEALEVRSVPSLFLSRFLQCSFRLPRLSISFRRDWILNTSEAFFDHWIISSNTRSFCRKLQKFTVADYGCWICLFFETPDGLVAMTTGLVWPDSILEDGWLMFQIFTAEAFRGFLGFLCCSN